MYPNYLLKFRNRLNTQLRQRLFERHGDTYFSEEMFRRIEKGRKIRSFLFLTASQSLNGSLDEMQLVDVCLSIEMSHAASVLVDDILDGDDIRHGTPSSTVSLGTPTSVLQAHLLCAEALLAVSDMPAILKQLLQTYRKLTIGEMYDVFLIPTNSEWPLGGYGEFVYQKTSALFEFSLIAAANISRREDVAEPLRQLGHVLGRLYQFSNDYFDLQPHNWEKRHSKSHSAPVTFSLPFALYLKHYGTTSVREFLQGRVLSFHEWMTFLKTVWRPKVQAEAKESLENSLTEVLKTLELISLPNGCQSKIRSLARLINTEAFWYHTI